MRPKYMKRQIKTQHQVIVSGDGAQCPYCGQFNKVTCAEPENLTKAQLWFTDPKTRCEHECMTVDAGFGQMAIHFEGYKGGAE